MSSTESLPPVCILAGGLGKRLGTVVDEVPKPLIEVAGEPFLVHQLRLLAANGVDRVALCVGYRGEQIEARLGPECCGIEISYSYDSPELDGTLGAIRRAADSLEARFLVLYGDAFLRMDYRAAVAAWTRSGLPAMMAVLHNENRWDTSNATFDGTRVTAHDKHAPSADMHWIDYGLGGLDRVTLATVGPEERDLAVLYSELARRGELFGYEATERFYEIGSPASLAETDAFLRTELRAQGPL